LAKKGLPGPEEGAAVTSHPDAPPLGEGGVHMPYDGLDCSRFWVLQTDVLDLSDAGFLRDPGLFNAAGWAVLRPLCCIQGAK
jgi:hypothetical protein